MWSEILITLLCYTTSPDGDFWDKSEDTELKNRVSMSLIKLPKSWGRITIYALKKFLLLSLWQVEKILLKLLVKSRDIQISFVNRECLRRSSLDLYGLKYNTFFKCYKIDRGLFSLFWFLRASLPLEKLILADSVDSRDFTNNVLFALSGVLRSLVDVINRKFVVC